MQHILKDRTLNRAWQPFAIGICGGLFRHLRAPAGYGAYIQNRYRLQKILYNEAFAGIFVRCILPFIKYADIGHIKMAATAKAIAATKVMLLSISP